MAVVTHTGSQLVKTALVSTEAGFTTCRLLAETARLGADAALFGARCARESLAYVAFGVAAPPSPAVPSPSLSAAARRGATMLQSFSNAAAMREAAVNLTPAPLRVAIGVASSLMRPRQLVGPAAKPEMQAVGDAGGRPALADRMVPARPPQHHD